MEIEHFLAHLQQTNQLEKISHFNVDGMPNMKYKYIRDLYHQYLHQQTPSFECSICMENITDNMCKLKCGHAFCVECFSNLARTSNKCALCRDPLSGKQVKKEINENALIDIVQYELDTPYEERENMNMYEYVQYNVKHLIESQNNGKNKVCPLVLSRHVNRIVQEIFDSLHTVAYISIETMNDQYN